jgi:hypothetical protein
MNELAGPPSYVAHANVLEHEAIWRLPSDALELQGGPTAGPDVVMQFPIGSLRPAQRILLGEIFVILASIPLLIAYTRKSWPSRFKPDAIPGDVLLPA